MIKCILHKLHIANTITIPSMKERDRLCQLYIYIIYQISFSAWGVFAPNPLT